MLDYYLDLEMFSVLSIDNIIATYRTSTNACIRVHIFWDLKKSIVTSHGIFALIYGVPYKTKMP